MTTNDVRSQQAKEAFIKYLAEHPDERFWQALTNFSGNQFIFVYNAKPGDVKSSLNDLDNLRAIEGVEDPYHREEL